MKCLWEDCDQSDVEDLKEHVDCHIEDSKEYKCLWIGCNKKGDLLSKAGFLAHMRTHSGDRPFKCTKCSKNFTRNDALNKHLKRHEAEDKAVQEQVNKAFYLTDERDIEETKTMELLRERQLNANILRILHDFISDDCEEGWKAYL